MEKNNPEIMIASNPTLFICIIDRKEIKSA